MGQRAAQAKSGTSDQSSSFEACHHFSIFFG
jgi:hypothetical protein